MAQSDPVPQSNVDIITRPTTFDGRISWQIDDILNLAKFESSMHMEFRFGQTVFKFKICLSIFDDDISLVFCNCSDAEVKISCKVSAINTTTAQILSNQTRTDTIKNFNNIMFNIFLSKKKLEEDLTNSIKVNINFIIYLDTVCEVKKRTRGPVG
jgi:hypothetical protein